MFIKISIVLVLCQVLFVLSQNIADQYGCPLDMRLNSIGEEIMNNDNYIK